jgi:hypothetical protein
MLGELCGSTYLRVQTISELVCNERVSTAIISSAEPIEAHCNNTRALFHAAGQVSSLHLHAVKH